MSETPRVSTNCAMQSPSQEEAGHSEERESPSGKEDVLVSPAVIWCPGEPLQQPQWQSRSRCCLGQGCPCPLATNTCVCPVLHRCGYSCVQAPLLGTLASYCQLTAAGGGSMGQEAGPTRRKRWGW